MGARAQAGPAGAGLVSDARRRVYYAKPVLRGWLHVLCSWASLAGGAPVSDHDDGPLMLPA
jgi:hypothetical protein